MGGGGGGVIWERGGGIGDILTFNLYKVQEGRELLY